MESKAAQWATIALAFLVGRVGSTPSAADAAQSGIATQEGRARTEGPVASRLPIAKEKPAREDCREADDIGKVRVFVGTYHYTAKAFIPTYPPKPDGPYGPPPGLWFCAWDDTDPEVGAWYEVPGTRAEFSQPRRR
jgi:hypothetical protein